MRKAVVTTLVGLAGPVSEALRLPVLGDLQRLALAVGTVTLAGVATFTLLPWLQPGIAVTFVPAVMLAAYVGGVWSGLLAALLSVIASELLPNDPPMGWLTIGTRLAIFAAVAVAFASMSARQRGDRRTLEQRVKARTAELEEANAALCAEIAERKQLEQRLEYLVEHDALTGLFNRRRFEKALAEEVSRASRYRTGGAVLLLDVDGFKEVNDTLGHRAGDQLLTTVGRALKTCVRHTDIVARLGGDEFGVLLRCVDDAQAGHVADGIVKATRRQVALGKQVVGVTTSVGVATLEGTSGSHALARADFAMYEAKKLGGNRYARYVKPASGPPNRSRHFSEFERLRHAIDQNRFTLYCQPIVDLELSTVNQYELLLRMLDEDNRPVPPGSFLPIAERLGLVVAIDSWVLTEAVKLIAQQTRLGRPLTLNVNISGRSVGDPVLVDAIDRALRATPIDPSLLVFEVTETAAIANLEDAKTFAQGLRVRGCKLALDDFGTGFGSFFYLKHVPFDYLKIDGDFIRGFTVNATDRLVVEAIVRIAKGMGKKTIAEFVSGPQIAQQLRRSGVNYGQGYPLGEPQPVARTFASA